MVKLLNTNNTPAEIQIRSSYQTLLLSAKILICLGLCLLSIGIFASHTLKAYDNPGLDFLYFYSGGVLWNRSLNVYDANLFYSTAAEFNSALADQITPIYYYLPPASVAFGLFARLDFRTAYNIEWTIILISTVISILLLGVILSWYRPIGLLEITLLCLLLNTFYGRIAIEVGQISSVMFVVILVAFILSRYERWIQASIVLSLLVIKFTYLPLYMGYLLLKRHYRAFIICLVMCCALCIVPLVITQKPLVSTFIDWTHMMQQSTGFTNSPSPFSTLSVTLINLEPLIYRIFDAQSLIPSAINWLIIGSLVLYSAYLITRSTLTHKARLLDFALVSLLSLLCVYHRNYDIFFTFPAILYIYVHTQEQQSGPARRNWRLFLVFVLLGTVGPNNLLETIYRQLVSLELQSTYLGRLIAPYHIWLNIILLIIILRLKWQQLTIDNNSIPDRMVIRTK